MNDPETLLEIHAFDQLKTTPEETSTPLVQLPTPKVPAPEVSTPELTAPETIAEEPADLEIEPALLDIEEVEEVEEIEEEVEESIEEAIQPITETPDTASVDVEPADVEIAELIEVDAVWSIRVRPTNGQDFVLPLDGTTVTVGRAETNDLHLDDRQLSRHHARIAVEDGDWVVTDLSSKNGTTVNGASIERCVIRHGDLILVGEAALVLDQEVELPVAVVPAPIAQPSTEPTTDPAPAHTQQQPAPDAPKISKGRLQTLLSFGEMLACAEDELGVLEEVVTRMRDVLRADRAVLFLVEEGQSKPLMQYASEDTRTGEPDAAAEAVMELAMAAEEPVTDSIVGPNARHVCVVPMHARYRKLGVLVIERGPGAEPFDEQDVHIASIAASQVTTFLRSVL